jgi:hypothetical protein
MDTWPDPLQQHWLKIENAFLGAAATADGRRNFWHSVTYYNFLQELAGVGPRRVPVDSACVWNDAHEPFLSVIDALQPAFVVVLGKRVWSHLPRASETAPALQVEGKMLERYRYRLASGKNVIASRVAHPAAGLGATWRPVLLRAIEEL